MAFFSGHTAGPGLATGPARVIQEPWDLFVFRKGEILACQAMDPGMSFVVPLAGGSEVGIPFSRLTYPFSRLEGHGGYRSAKEKTPGHIYNDNLQGPSLDQGHVGQLIGGIGKKTEKSAPDNGPGQGVLFKGRDHRKEDNPDYVYEIEYDGRCPIYLGTQDEPQVLVVEISGNYPEPDQVHQEKDGYGHEIEFDIEEKVHAECPLPA